MLRPSTRIVALLVVFLSVYAALLGFTVARDSDAIFPFNRWDLFSKVPNAMSRNYSLRFVEVDGRVLDEPVYFDHAHGVVDDPGSPVASQLMQDLGHALSRGDDDAAFNAHLQLQARFMQGIGSARYEVVYRTFDVLERHRCGCFISEETVEVLEKWG